MEIIDSMLSVLRSVRVTVGGTPERSTVSVSDRPSRSDAAAPGWMPRAPWRGLRAGSIDATRSRSSGPRASSSASAVSVALTKWRLIADLLVPAAACSTCSPTGSNPAASRGWRSRPASPPAQRDRALLAAVQGRAPVRIAAALRLARCSHVLVHHRGHHPGPPSATPTAAGTVRAARQHRSSGSSVSRWSTS
jgi:hypothetical protein